MQSQFKVSEYMIWNFPLYLQLHCFQSVLVQFTTNIKIWQESDFLNMTADPLFHIFPVCLCLSLQATRSSYVWGSCQKYILCINWNRSNLKRDDKKEILKISLVQQYAETDTIQYNGTACYVYTHLFHLLHFIIIIHINDLSIKVS